MTCRSACRSAPGSSTGCCCGLIWTNGPAGSCAGPYGPFGNTGGHVVPQKDPDSTSAYDLALFSTDRAATGEVIAERYAVRWSIEPSNANGKQQADIGQARNRLPRAVERTVPFEMIVQSMVITWYALYGHDPTDVTDRAIAQPWYRTKTEPSFEDMILKLRTTIIAARVTTVAPGQPDPDLLHGYAPACAATAA